jgi:hypothetical protein
MARCLVLVLTIYGYEKQGQVLYVGQTKNPLKTRDSQHRRGTSEFAKDLMKDAILYAPPKILEQTTMTCSSEGPEEEVEFMMKCHAWMDEREIHWIKHYGTYTSVTGLNFTSGGQFGAGLAYAEYRRKVREKIWKEQYMPIFRKCSYIGRLWETPSRYEEGGIPLGRILAHVRMTGSSSMAESCENEMREQLGFDNEKTYFESKWEIDYIPLFRKCFYAGHLWKTPRSYEEGGIKLGRILCDVRTGNTTLPPSFENEMRDLGFDKRKSQYESRWEVITLPALQECFYAGRLWATPCNYTFRKIKIGLMLKNFRSKGVTNGSHLAQLNLLGFKRSTTKTLRYCSSDRDGRDELENSPVMSKRARLE